MGRAAKGGRKKKLWDLKATVAELDRILGTEEDPGEKDSERAFLHFVRALCRSLDTNLPAMMAFDRLLRLTRDKAGPVRRYAHEVNGAFEAYRPLWPTVNEVLKRGEAEELWKLWFFACEMPRRLRTAMANVDRLLYAAEEFMPEPFNVPGFQIAAVRAAVIAGLRSHGYEVDGITRLLDPLGYAENARAARDRIRQEVRRLKLMIGRDQRDRSSKARISSVVGPAEAGQDTPVEAAPRPPQPPRR